VKLIKALFRCVDASSQSNSAAMACLANIALLDSASDFFATDGAESSASESDNKASILTKEELNTYITAVADQITSSDSSTISAALALLTNLYGISAYCSSSIGLSRLTLD